VGRGKLKKISSIVFSVDDFWTAVKPLSFGEGFGVRLYGGP
jgi:hypothetical protein